MSYMIKSLLVITISLFFLFSIFLAIKIYYEIQRTRKLQGLINDLTYWKSFFFLKRFIELKNLAGKNKKYQMILATLFIEYQKLISQEVMQWMETYLKLITNRRKKWLQLIETEQTIKHHEKFRSLNHEVTIFTNTVKEALRLENYCLDQVYKLRTIHDLMHDEINKTILKVDFNFKKLQHFWNNLELKIAHFEAEVYFASHLQLKENLVYLFTVFNRQILNIINYLKLLLLVGNNLPLLHKKLLTLIETKLTGRLKKETLDWFNQYYESEQHRLQILLPNYNHPDLEQEVLNFYRDLLTKKHQLEKLKPMQITLQKSVALFTKVEEQILLSDQQLQRDINNLHRETYVFFYPLQGIEELQFNLKTWHQKLKAWRIMHQQQKDYIFLANQFAVIQTLITWTFKYLTQHQEIRYIFQAEKKRIELVILTILNLNTFLSKPAFRLFRQIYYADLKTIMRQFGKLEANLQGKSERKKVAKITHQFDQLEVLVTTLKEKIERQVVLLKLARQLFVLNNRFRFHTPKIHNQMLNAEMIYLKGNYAKTIERLVEVYEQKN